MSHNPQSMFALVKSAAPLALFFALATPALAADWQIVKVGNREYLTVDNIAKFYGLTTSSQPAEKHVRDQQFSELGRVRTR